MSTLDEVIAAQRVVDGLIQDGAPIARTDVHDFGGGEYGLVVFCMHQEDIPVGLAHIPTIFTVA